MASKARAFPDNEDLLSKILSSREPAAIKAYGRQVRNFDSKIWDSVKVDIVYKGNMAKFSQSPALREILLSTGEALLVEASPDDTVWGVGLSISDHRIQDPSKYRGTNLLGKILMDVRRSLRNEV